jgi:hypothetical protein
VHIVANDTELAAKIRTAAGGDEIRLRPGRYASLKVWTAYDPKWAVPITITADDPSNRPEIAQMEMAGAVGVKMTNLVFAQSVAAGAPVWTREFELKNYNDQKCENIEISNCLFIGSNAVGVSPVEDGFGTGNGLALTGVKGCKIIDNEFRTFYRGAIFGQSQDLLIKGNKFFDMASDAMDFAEVQGVRITENTIRDFRMHPDSQAHPDCIQFWTSGTNAPSTDIEIDHNVIFNLGDFSQSIFMRNERVDQGLSGDEMFYRSIKINNNIIVNSHTHGITVGETDGLAIENNTLLNAKNLVPGGMVYVPRIHVAVRCRNVKIAKNIMPILEFWPSWSDPKTPPAEWQILDFSILQREDATLPTFYGAVLQNPLSPTFAWANFLPKPGTNEERLGIGARPLAGSTPTPVPEPEPEPTPTPTPTPTPDPTPTPVPPKVYMVESQALLDWADKLTRRGKERFPVEKLREFVTANQKLV